MAAGLGHTVACSDSGDVYSWGWNADGQLGLGDDQSRGEPELVADAQLEDLHIDQVICCRKLHCDCQEMITLDHPCAWAWMSRSFLCSFCACL